MQIHTHWRQCTDTLPHTVLDCSRRRCPASLSAFASMLERHVPRWDTSHYASMRNFMMKSVNKDRRKKNSEVVCRQWCLWQNCSLGYISSYMGWGFPLASHSMTMVSLGSTICSFIDCFMMVGGCLTAGREINQFSIFETYMVRQYKLQMTCKLSYWLTFQRDVQSPNTLP